MKRNFGCTWTWSDERCLAELKRLDRTEQRQELINNLYIVKGAKYIKNKITTDTAKIKTKAWFYGALAGICIMTVLQTLSAG